jgi:hypothetical protein
VYRSVEATETYLAELRAPTETHAGDAEALECIRLEPEGIEDVLQELLGRQKDSRESRARACAGSTGATAGGGAEGGG